ncbi:MAG TPA: T9SS type A sorting domain-containing protein [Flavobacteriaceae bacterium]|nr:T9SS type A sorting domain-containing protein [Flavobacteriaceae bacterium]
MKPLLLFISIVLTSFSVHGQTTKKVLFLGNSYTAANNLPLMVSDMATSTGDLLLYSSYTPGGYRFLNHASDPTSLDKINSDNWDYVVLQGQSQETAFSQQQLESEVYPYAVSLSTAIRENNACSQPLFYMTWGRKEGDEINCQYAPWMCTYEGMDDAIKDTYLFMAESNDAELAAAGAVWRYIRENHPNIELYSSDGSHPSLAGSYSAATTFYTMIYKKDPTLISWDSNLTANEASLIRDATKTIVYDAISTWDFTENPMADFTKDIQNQVVSFTNESSDYDHLLWEFGDSNTSVESNPIHTYEESGIYTVSLTTTKCGKTDTKTKTLDITILSTEDFSVESIKIYPNPSSKHLNLNLGKTYKEITISISNLLGKTVLRTSRTNADTLILEVSSLAKGTYILKLEADGDTKMKRIVRQ